MKYFSLILYRLLISYVLPGDLTCGSLPCHEFTYCLLFVGSGWDWSTDNWEMMTDRVTVTMKELFGKMREEGVGLSDTWGFGLTSQSDSSLVLHSHVYLLMVFWGEGDGAKVIFLKTIQGILRERKTARDELEERQFETKQRDKMRKNRINRQRERERESWRQTPTIRETRHLMLSAEIETNYFFSYYSRCMFLDKFCTIVTLHY